MNHFLSSHTMNVCDFASTRSPNMSSFSSDSALIEYFSNQPTSKTEKKPKDIFERQINNFDGDLSSKLEMLPLRGNEEKENSDFQIRKWNTSNASEQMPIKGVVYIDNRDLKRQDTLLWRNKWGGETENSAENNKRTLFERSLLPLGEYGGQNFVFPEYRNETSETYQNDPRKKIENSAQNDQIYYDAKIHRDDESSRKGFRFLVSSEQMSQMFVGALNENQKFEDALFPPSQIFLRGSERGYDRKKAIEWLRPEVFFGHDYSVFRQINVEDILQGALGDCYFLAALASIAATPSRLERLFLSNASSDNGAYAVALFIEGGWVAIGLDDRFPCVGDPPSPAFSRSTEKELWVMLLEKAWGKIHGSYERISAGNPTEALTSLSGAPCKTYTTEDPEMLFRVLANAFGNNFPVTASSKELKNFPSQGGEASGVEQLHAYSVLGVFTVLFGENGNPHRLLTSLEDQDNFFAVGKVEKLIKLRNPWGKSEWTGAWSDKSSIWTPHLKALLGLISAEDGEFFMTLKDFTRYFFEINVLFFHDSYRNSMLRFTSSEGQAHFFRLKLKQKGEYFITLHQKNKRLTQKNENYEYSYLTLKVGDKFKPIFQSSEKESENSLSISYDKEDIIVSVEVPYREIPKTLTLGIYGPGEAEITPLSPGPETSRLKEVWEISSQFSSNSPEVSKKDVIVSASDMSNSFFQDDGRFHIYSGISSEPGLWLENTKIDIVINNQSTEYSRKLSKTPKGLLMTFENLNENRSVIEKFMFRLINCQFKHMKSNFLKVVTGPKNRQSFELVSVAGLEPQVYIIETEVEMI